MQAGADASFPPSAACVYYRSKRKNLEEKSHCYFVIYETVKTRKAPDIRCPSLFFAV
jgi:hypothetical protein